jgi:histidyl-tRNA synthetase
MNIDILCSVLEEIIKNYDINNHELLIEFINSLQYVSSNQNLRKVCSTYYELNPIHTVEANKTSLLDWLEDFKEYLSIKYKSDS